MTETKHAEVTEDHREAAKHMEGVMWYGGFFSESGLEKFAQLLADHDAEVERKARLDEAMSALHDYDAVPHRALNPIGSCSQCRRIAELQRTP